MFKNLKQQVKSAVNDFFDPLDDFFDPLVDLFARNNRSYHYTFYDKTVEVDGKKYNIELWGVLSEYMSNSEAIKPNRVDTSTQVDIFINGNNTGRRLTLTDVYTPEQYLRDIAAAVDSYRNKIYEQKKLDDKWSEFRHKKD